MRFRPTDDIQQADGSLSALQLPQNSQPSRLNMHQGDFITMPPQVGSSPKFVRQNVVADALFQPSWMYFPHIYLHQLPLEIDYDVLFKQVDSYPGLRKAIANWKGSKEFNTSYVPRIFPPHVADSGTKKGSVSGDRPSGRQMDIEWCESAAAFYTRLTASRTFDSAKKRLIELTSFHQDLTLICWLASPPEQKMQFLEFLRRHGSSESSFGERVDWKANMWETDLHLGFFQLLSKEDNKIYPPPLLDYQGQFRIREMPSLSQTSSSVEITPVTTSFRFVGDLRDQAWTCHFLTSVARDNGFTGLVNEYTDGNGEPTAIDFHKEKMAQRKILEMAYVDRMLIEIAQSCEGILVAFGKELDVLEARDPQSESFEFIHNYSRLHSKTGEILRDVLNLIDRSARTLEEWEKREVSRDIRSRWSQKDETRYGSKLVDLARKCKIGMQQVRVQRDLLEEQRKRAEQRHSNFVNYMSLQAARTSSQSAEDVRLFTYVTIIFLPLSFSSSLFSMGGAPEGGTLSIMVPTTAIALAVTILALANMKVLDRNLSFWAYKLNASARRKMEAAEGSWGFQWKKISKDLEEAGERRLFKPEKEKELPAQSRWWYILFWTSYGLESFRLYTLEGFRMWKDRSDPDTKRITVVVKVLKSIYFVPACACIFVVQFLTVSASDLLWLVWQMVRWLKAKILGHAEGQKVREHNASSNGGEQVRPSSNVGTFEKWFQDPPRPLQRLINKLEPLTGATDSTGPQPSESEGKVEPLIHSGDLRSEEDEWETFVEKNLVARGEILSSEAQPGILEHRQSSRGLNKEKSAWWPRIKRWEAPESKV